MATLRRASALEFSQNLIMFSLANKTAIVTGGASGIGLAIAKRFIAAGAQVLVVDRRMDGQKTAQDIGAKFFRVDVSEEKEVAGMFEMARTNLGPVEILVNNAGIQPLGVGFNQLTGELLRRTLDVNVNSVAFGIKHAAHALATAGRIINIASFVGMLATPGAAAYATSKAAVIHLTKLAAIELAPRQITVNAVSPGTILTPAVTEIPNNPEISFVEKRTPLGRLGMPDEVASLCHFLATDEAAYITGQNIAIDGGLTAGWMEYALVPPANVQNGRWVDDV
jgi:NAD(P)-dependent dehydrogenase (short-subunit alcohol dehydrogenase family)